MTENKQIEKIARDVCPLIEEYGSCEACDAELDIEDDPCLYKCMSKLFASKGYCKASEIAEELLEMAECYGAGVLFWRKVKQSAIEFKKNCTEEPNANNNH